jgi:cell division protein FtsL
LWGKIRREQYPYGKKGSPQYLCKNVFTYQDKKILVRVVHYKKKIESGVLKRGVVISVFQKDYELRSWNKQGEITKVEGMLTIAFLVVSSCSHKDNWKQLYVIVKIPYLVNMFTQQEILEENWQLRKEIDGLKSRISKLELENNKLRAEIDDLKKENQELKRENQRLKEILGKKRVGKQF